MNITNLLDVSRPPKCPARDRRYRLSLLPLLVCLLIAAAMPATARTFPLEKISRGTQEFSGFVSYEVEKAYAGNSNLELIVSLNTKGTTNLELVSLEPPDSAKIRFQQISNASSSDPVTGLLTTEYKYLVNIPIEQATL